MFSILVSFSFSGKVIIPALLISCIPIWRAHIPAVNIPKNSNAFLLSILGTKRLQRGVHFLLNSFKKHQWNVYHPENLLSAPNCRTVFLATSLAVASEEDVHYTSSIQKRNVDTLKNFTFQAYWGNTWQTPLCKFRMYSMMVWFTFIGKWWPQ